MFYASFIVVVEFSEWFSLALSGEVVTLNVASEIPQVVLESYRQLLFAVVANKPGTTAARAAISIDLPDGKKTGKPKFESIKLVNMRHRQYSY